MTHSHDPLVGSWHVPKSEVAESVRSLGVRLKEARLRRNCTMAYLEEMTGISRRTLSEIERGNPASGIGAYVAYLRALGLGEQLDDLATAERDIDEVSVDTGRKRARTPRV